MVVGMFAHTSAYYHGTDLSVLPLDRGLVLRSWVAQMVPVSVLDPPEAHVVTDIEIFWYQRDPMLVNRARESPLHYSPASGRLSG